MKIGDTNPFLLNPVAKPMNQPEQSAPGFGSILKQAVGEVNKLQGEANQKMTSEILSDQEDLHTVMISMEKAGLGLKLLVQTRDKLIKAYEELKNMQM
jgi:flagellar hook-basal body complex protein FliE